MGNEQGYQAIRALARDLGWPTSWRADLTTTCRRVLCAKHAPPAFGFGIRPTGCDLFLPGEYASLRFARGQCREPAEQRYYWLAARRWIACAAMHSDTLNSGNAPAVPGNGARTSRRARHMQRRSRAGNVRVITLPS